MSSLVEFELWARNSWPAFDVVGESYHEPAIRALFRPPIGQAGQELILRAVLVPEPNNRYDRNAVMVVVQGQHVGYLPKEAASAYQPMIAQLNRQGFAAVTPCRVWASEYESFDSIDLRGRSRTKMVLSASVRLVLDEWWMCVPANLPPLVPHVLLPQGSALQVRKEEEHQERLRPLLRPQGEAWAYATLGVVVDVTARASKELVEIRIDGQRIGELTPSMSAEFIPIIRQLERAGKQTAARVVVKGNQIKADVVLYAQKASQLDASWIAANAPDPAATVAVPTPVNLPAAQPGPATPVPAAVPHLPIPPKPTRIAFNPPPGWPTPPAGWEPYPGWLVPADWPPAPADWVYWVLADT